MPGIALSLLAAVGWGGGRVIAWLGLQYLAPALGTFVSVLSSLGALSLVVTFFQPEALNLSWTIALWFALVGVLNFALGRFFSFQGIKHLGASRASIIQATNPLFAVALAIVLLGEIITWPIALGTAAIVGGLILVVSEAP